MARKSENSNESYLKEKYTEMQYISQQMELIDQQIEKMDEQMQDIMATDNSLMEFSNITEGNEMLVSIANGIFAKASLKEKKTLLVNVGSNIVVEKDVEQTRILLKEQLEEITKYRTQLIIQNEALSTRVKFIEQEVDERVK